MNGDKAIEGDEKAENKNEKNSSIGSSTINSENVRLRKKNDVKAVLTGKLEKPRKEKFVKNKKKNQKIKKLKGKY